MGLLKWSNCITLPKKLWLPPSIYSVLCCSQNPHELKCWEMQQQNNSQIMPLSLCNVQHTLPPQYVKKHVPIRGIAVVFLRASKGSPTGLSLFLGCTAASQKAQPRLTLMWLMQDFQTRSIQRAHGEHVAGCRCPQCTDVTVSLERQDITRQN